MHSCRSTVKKFVPTHRTSHPFYSSRSHRCAAKEPAHARPITTRLSGDSSSFRAMA